MEAEYRKLVQETLDRIERVLSDTDPDIVECNQQLGALTLQFPNGAKCILSAQPSVRQLWMAVASKGIAFHFNYDPATGRWQDDKGRGIELFSYLRDYLKEATGLDFAAMGG